MWETCYRVLEHQGQAEEWMGASVTMDKQLKQAIPTNPSVQKYSDC